MLEQLKNQNKLVIGTKQALKAVKEGRAQTLFIAKDAEKHVTRNIEELAKEMQLQIVYVDSMKKLGKACGIDVSAATAVILK
ncbi:ribosomal L7Ae/L30e/S12e/Gadd45 family protein [Thermotalea metallivorans]|uniref:Ribosome-associated protein L7Ae-like protein n=1 Tax=Thermotalea metallivorans TaxID=520762 RepID=A0A140L2L4_9FIRM|nr:ribosomal L7Ae/L30e/S12e/Gadd45 family protein [Thermotalea metallivorans]KXG74789.1 Ribosome-associated protein L7Ae-like protein [Thermotalea metallivorans]